MKFEWSSIQTKAEAASSRRTANGAVMGQPVSVPAVPPWYRPGWPEGGRPAGEPGSPEWEAAWAKHFRQLRAEWSAELEVAA